MKVASILTRKGIVGLGVAALLLLPLQTLEAQDTAVANEGLAGNWIITVDSPEGAVEMTWELETSEDGSLSGLTISDMIGEWPFDGGWVDGDTFAFTVYIEAQGQAFDVVFDGTFADDELSGMLEAGGGEFTADFTGVRKGGVR